jgi:ligand-binding sensor domain-containing protein
MSHQLPQLREALLELHKTLVESERISYEQTIGTISSPNHFLQLLVNDPWFAWLHPISLLVVTMDQAIDSKRKPLTDADAEALVKQARELLVAAEEGEGFPKHYFDALQRDPEVVMAHAAAAKYFAVRKPHL